MDAQIMDGGRSLVPVRSSVPLCSSAANSARCDSPDREEEIARSRAWTKIETSIGRRYARCTFESFQDASEHQKAVKLAVIALAKYLPHLIASGGGSLLLFGTPGTGKDHLAVAALRAAVMAHGLTAAATDGQTLFSKARDCIQSDSKEQDFISAYTRPDVLLISDPVPIGMSPSEFQRSLLWRIYDARYRDLKPTWSTLNVANREELEARCGAQLADRMRDQALCLHCHWESYRKPASRGATVNEEATKHIEQSTQRNKTT